MRLQDLKEREMERGYYMVCVEINHNCFDDSVEIDFNNKFPLRFVESEIVKDYPEDKYDSLGYAKYVGYKGYGMNGLNLYFQLKHKIDLDGVNKKSFYYLLCKACYIENISTIIKDINQSC